MDQSDSVSRAGAIFGNYRVVRELGRGGMGAVYFAEHKFLPGKVAAVKVLLPESSRDRAMTESVLQRGDWPSRSSNTQGLSRCSTAGSRVTRRIS